MMTYYTRSIFFLLLINSIFANNDRLVTIGGSITDIVFELGLGDIVVAVDQSSTLPKEVKELPQVGYVRAISTEGILSMMPTKILTSSDIGPPNVVDQLKSSGIDFRIFNSPSKFEDIIQLVDEISSFLNVESKGKKLKDKLMLDLEKINKNNFNKDNPSIAFFMNPTMTGNLNAAGEGTRANYFIEFIGGSNIFKSSFKRYNKINKETLINTNPDIIFVASTDSELQSTSVFLNDRSFENLNAVKNGKIIYLDLGYHLTFGSKFGEASLFALNLILDED